MTSVPLKCVTTCMAIFFAAQLAGCQNIHLYSDKRNQQGTDAKTAWAKVDLPSLIATDRDNLNKILQAQLDLQDKYAISIRDHRLRTILVSDETVGVALGEQISVDLETLLGTGDIDKAIDTYLGQSSSTGNISVALARIRFSQAQVSTPSCKELSIVKHDNGDLDVLEPTHLAKLIDKLNSSATDADKKRLARLESAFKSLVKGCDELGNSSIYDGFIALKGGSLQEALVDMKHDAAALVNAKNDGLKLQNAYTVANEAYKKAIGNIANGETPALLPKPKKIGDGEKMGCEEVETSKLQPTQIEVATAAHKLCEAVIGIETANNAFGKKFLSQERLESLQKLVDTINQTKPGDSVPIGASRLTTAYVLLPGLVDEANAAISAKKKPVAMSFLIQRNIDQLKLEAANREVALLETRAKLSVVVVEGIISEGVLLKKARTNLRKNVSLNAQPMATVFEKASVDDKVTLYSALTNYTDAISRQEVKWRKARQQRLATYHEVALAYAEVNLKQWTSLIDTSVQQVSDSAAGGIKSDSITNILNTLGVFYIGRGVNK